jgi:hypothetical protein
MENLGNGQVVEFEHKVQVLINNLADKQITFNVR